MAQGPGQLSHERNRLDIAPEGEDGLRRLNLYTGRNPVSPDTRGAESLTTKRGIIELKNAAS